MDVVILAGGHCSPDLKSATGQDRLKDIRIGEQSLIQHIKGCVSHLGEPLIVGGEETDGPRVAPSGKHFIDSLRIAIDNAESETLLTTTVDLPCLTQESIDDFIAKADPDAAFNYPIVDIALAEQAFPGMKRTTLKLKEGTFTGGNISVMRVDLVRKAMPILERAYEHRKSPIKLASLVGIRTLMLVAATRIAPSLVPLRSLEDSVSKFLQTRVKAIRSGYAEIAADLDSAEQYEQFVQHFKSAETVR